MTILHYRFVSGGDGQRSQTSIELTPQPRQIDRLHYVHHYQQDTPTRGQGNWFAR
jgi:hypothetical protein